MNENQKQNQTTSFHSQFISPRNDCLTDNLLQGTNGYQSPQMQNVGEFRNQYQRGTIGHLSPSLPATRDCQSPKLRGTSDFPTRQGLSDFRRNSGDYPGVNRNEYLGVRDYQREEYRAVSPRNREIDRTRGELIILNYRNNQDTTNMLS